MTVSSAAPAMSARTAATSDRLERGIIVAMLRPAVVAHKDDDRVGAVTLRDVLPPGEGAARMCQNRVVTPQPPELPDLVDPPVTLAAVLRRDLPRGIRSGLQTFWSLAKAMIPAYGLALVLEKVGAITVLARVAQPVMSLVGLPGSAALPLVLGWVLNVYAAVGAMTALHLDARQITVLALAILIGHNLLVEGAVLRKAGMSGVGFGVLRALSGLLAAGVANLLMKAFS